MPGGFSNPVCLDRPALAVDAPLVHVMHGPIPLSLPASLAQIFAPENRARRVVFLLAATALMCLGDLALTLTYTTSMGMVETNPIARAVMANNSPLFVVLWKLATMVLGLGILFWARRVRAAETAAWLCFFIMVALCLHWLSFATVVSGLPSDYAQLASLDDPRWVSMTP
jgi:uncharacterized membrane protein YhaH (DUF805 family)